MAIDTRDKRASVLGVAMPSRVVFDTPHGSFIQADRQQLAYVYRGILASALVVPLAPAPLPGLAMYLFAPDAGTSVLLPAGTVISSGGAVYGSAIYGVAIYGLSTFGGSIPLPGTSSGDTAPVAGVAVSA